MGMILAFSRSETDVVMNAGSMLLNFILEGRNSILNKIATTRIMKWKKKRENVFYYNDDI